ncbi:hypothetical protein [Nostoc sp.]
MAQPAAFEVRSHPTESREDAGAIAPPAAPAHKIALLPWSNNLSVWSKHI